VSEVEGDERRGPRGNLPPALVLAALTETAHTLSTDNPGSPHAQGL
jgi:hypothetical protein